MFIELVDALRCPVVHEESWLVAAAARMEYRHIVTGTLGCPVCHAQYPIERGVVDFRHGHGTAPAAVAAPDEHGATRLAALLDLTDGGGFALLLGQWGVHAPLLRTIAETPLILVDPPEGTEGEPGISVIRSEGDLPLGAAASRGTAIDRANGHRVASALRATRAGGRVLAPVEVPLPDGVREIARDDRLWVAERAAAPSPLVALHVRRGR